MDEQIQQILNQATMPDASPSNPSSDPGIDSILQDAGVSPASPTPDAQPDSSISNDSSEPADVQNAQAQIGSQDDNGECQRFVEKVTTGKTGIYPSAADAWNDYVKQGKAYSDISKAPKGALIYYSPDTSNGGSGHVGVTDGNGNQISATYNGVQMTPINQWIQETGQTPLGYVIP